MRARVEGNCRGTVVGVGGRRRPSPSAVKVLRLNFVATFLADAAKITADIDLLLVFRDSPAEHWIHLRGANLIGSIFVDRTAPAVPDGTPGSRGSRTGPYAYDMPIYGS